MQDRLFIQQIIPRLKEAREKVRAEFAQLSQTQLNRKPAANKWSIAQCLDHLVLSDSLYFPVMEKIAEENYKMNWWQKNSPLSNFWGRFLVRNLEESAKRKMKTTSVFFPDSKPIDTGIISRFQSHIDKMIRLIENCSTDLDKTIITSPVTRLITYNLRDCFTFLTSHLHRHIGQAVRVKADKSFPLA